MFLRTTTRPSMSKSVFRSFVFKFSKQIIGGEASVSSKKTDSPKEIFPLFHFRHPFSIRAPEPRVCSLDDSVLHPQYVSNHRTSTQYKGTRLSKTEVSQRQWRPIIFEEESKSLRFVDPNVINSIPIGEYLIKNGVFFNLVVPNCAANGGYQRRTLLTCRRYICNHVSALEILHVSLNVQRRKI